MHAIRCVLTAVLLLPWPAMAQSGSETLLAALDSLAKGKPDQAYALSITAAGEIAQSVPFSVSHAVLTEMPATGFAMDVPRSSNIYAPGEQIEIYLEPHGYGYILKNDKHHYGFSVDLSVVDPSGTIMGGQTEIGTWQFDSRVPRLETFLTLTVELADIPEGEYVLDLSVHDLSARDVSTTQKLAIKMEN